MNTGQALTLAIRAFAFVGLATAFLPALARSRVRFAVTFSASLIAVLIWFRP